ncbi:hypothetical protein H845_3123 [Komagataeibacter xylinus E25]|nr:hypothetical protein H845_3123 [Komagataeibacter xylinus E25]
MVSSCMQPSLAAYLAVLDRMAVKYQPRRIVGHVMI